MLSTLIYSSGTTSNPFCSLLHLLVTFQGGLASSLITYLFIYLFSKPESLEKNGLTTRVIGVLDTNFLASLPLHCFGQV